MRIVLRYFLASLLGLVVGVMLEVGACFGFAYVYHPEALALLERDYGEHCREALRPKDYLQGLSLQSLTVARWSPWITS
jgi:hypothetical protein